MKLNAAQLACAAAGGTPEQIAALAVAPEANPPGNPGADANAAPGAAGAGAVAASGAAATGAVTATAPPAGEGTGIAAPAVAASGELVSHLKAEVAELTAKLLASQVQAEGFKAQSTAADGMLAVLRSAIGEKMVALGGSADIAAGYTHANIVEHYNRIDTVFKTQFRVGGVAAVASPDVKPNSKAQISPMFAAAVENSLVK